MINDKITINNISDLASKFGELFEYYYIKGIIQYLISNTEYNFDLKENNKDILKEYLNKYLYQKKSNKIIEIESFLKLKNMYNDDIGTYITLEGYGFFNKIKIDYKKIELMLFNDSSDEELKTDKNKLINTYFLQNNPNFKEKNFSAKYLEEKGNFINSDLMFVFKLRKKKIFLSFDLKHLFKNVFEKDYIMKLPSIYNRNKKMEFFISKLNFTEEYKENILQLITKDDFKNYFKNIAYQDSLISKYVQAGSYLYTFLEECKLHEQDLFNNKNIIIYGGVSYGIKYNKHTLNTNQYKILESFFEIYKYQNNELKFNDCKFLTDIDNNFYNRKDNRKLLSENGLNIILNKNEDFFPLDDDIRGLHKNSIKYYLEQKIKGYKILYLIGNPGIGKTTTLIDYLIKENKENNNLFFYAAPRTIINDSIRTSFVKNSKEDEYYVLLNNDDNKNKSLSLSLYTNIPNLKEMLSIGFDFKINDKLVFNINEQDKIETKNNAYDKNSTFQSNSDEESELINYNNFSEGVFTNLILYSNKLNKFLKEKNIKIKNFVITVALQALKYFNANNNDYKNFYNQFNSSYIMFDEMIGEENGVLLSKEFINFYNKLENISNKETTFIFADASASSEDYLQKIFTTKNHHGLSEINISYLKKDNLINFNNSNLNEFEKQEFNNQLKKDVNILKNEHENIKIESIINVNSYPAKSLLLNFKVNKFNKFNEKSLYKYEKFNEDILLKLNATTDNQIIIYKQNKEDCNEFKNFLVSNNKFEEHEVKIINSEDKDITNMEKYKVFIVTSTSSRGISYPKTTKIIAFIDDRDIPSELMEIVQLIYRMRGGFKENEFGEINYDNKDKFIDFILEIPSEKNEDVDFKNFKNQYNPFVLYKLIYFAILSRMSMNGVQIGNKQINLIPTGTVYTSKNKIDGKSNIDYDFSKKSELLTKLDINGYLKLYEEIEDFFKYYNELNQDVNLSENILDEISNVLIDEKMDYSLILKLLMNNPKYKIENGFLIIENINLQSYSFKKIDFNVLKKHLKDIEKTYKETNLDSNEYKEPKLNILNNSIKSFLDYYKENIKILENIKIDKFKETNLYNDNLSLIIELYNTNHLNKDELEQTKKRVYKYILNKYKSKVIIESNFIQTKKGINVKFNSYITTKIKDNNNDSNEFKISYSLFPLIVK